MTIRLDQILASAAAVPPFPKVAQRALSLLDDPMVSASKLNDVIALDAGLTATVLKASNSATYGRARQIDDLKQALAVLGNNRFRELVLASASAPFLGQGQRGYGLSQGELWRHSVATALLAEQLARESGVTTKGGLLFTAGLLHDLGKSVLSQFVEAGADEILQLVKQERRTFIDAERTVLGVDHAELGARVAERWNFSPELVELIRYHHDFTARPESKPLAALHLANVLCDLAESSNGIDGLEQRAQAAAAKLLGLTRKDLEGAVAELHVKLAQAEGMLAMAPRSAPEG